MNAKLVCYTDHPIFHLHAEAHISWGAYTKTLQDVCEKHLCNIKSLKFISPPFVSIFRFFPTSPSRWRIRKFDKGVSQEYYISHASCQCAAQNFATTPPSHPIQLLIKSHPTEPITLRVRLINVISSYMARALSAPSSQLYQLLFRVMAS